jgi:hypothetical protein
VKVPKHIVIPDEREAQLRHIAKVHQVSTADAVGLLVNWAIEDGRIEPGLQTITVNRIGELVEVDFGSFKRTFEVPMAQGFASVIGLMADPKKSELIDGVKYLIQLDENAERFFQVKRRGTSIKVGGEHGEERTLAPSIARDLAALIKQAATSAK